MLLLSSLWPWLVPAIAWIGVFTGRYFRRKSRAKNTVLPQLWRLRAPTPGRVTPGRESGIHLRPARQACRRSFAAANISRRRIAFMRARSEEHTSELQSLMRISYAVFCLKKQKIKNTKQIHDSK